MFGDDARGTTSVIGKTLEVAIVLLYIGLLATVLYGDVVPSHRSTVGSEVGQRTITAIAEDVQESIPPERGEAVVVVEIDLPATIAGRSYRIEVDDNRLSLSHPNPDIDESVPLFLDDRVESISGSLTGGRGQIRVENTDDSIEVRLS